MGIRVIVMESIQDLWVAVEPGAADAAFQRTWGKELRRVDRDSWFKYYYRRPKAHYPTDWPVYWLRAADKYRLQDVLVALFDDAVTWPDYQWSLGNLRARRDRFRAANAPRQGAEAKRRARPAEVLPLEIVKAYKALDCPVGSDPKSFNRCYHDACLRLHPDRGGSHAQMAVVNDAVERLRTFWRDKHTRKHVDG
jgi:hypothetical protein